MDNHIGDTTEMMRPRICEVLGVEVGEWFTYPGMSTSFQVTENGFLKCAVIPINGWSEQGEDTLDNMLPACRSCNHYKSRSTLEGFRKMVENMPTVLMRDSVTYKNAVRFGLVTPTPHPVKFYSEQLGR